MTLYFFFLFILGKYSDNKKVTLYQNLFSTIIPSSYICNKKYVDQNSIAILRFNFVAQSYNTIYVSVVSVLWSDKNTNSRNQKEAKN